MAPKKFDDEEEQPRARKLALPAVKLPNLAQVRGAIASVRIPTVDLGIIAGGLAIALISAGAAVVGVRIFLPEKKVQIVRDPNEVKQAKLANPPGMPDFTIGPNVSTAFITHISHPRVDQLAYVHRQASVIGAVKIDAKAFVAPQASIRGDEGQDIYVGEQSAVLDGAVLHGVPTEQGGIFLERNQVRVMGQRYSIYVGARVTLAQQSQIFGPAIIGDDTFIGQQALVLRAMVGKRCVVEPRAAIIGDASIDLTIPDGRYVPAGVIVRNQTQADILPVITGDYALRDLNSQQVEVNTALAEGYIAMYPRAAAAAEAEA
ncbi:MAG: hypothetical protein FJZ01_18825, partial [Candidatus Sericytochromatia bacterium]|nr:hypothetical protein [Candidatus Tanganyikabacteria bacterium]